MRVVFGLFLVAHGLVHAIYVGQAVRLFEVKPGLTWPDGSWALSGLLGDAAVRTAVAVGLSLVALGFAVAGVGLIFGQTWWEQVAAISAAISTLVLVLAWNGQFRALDAQGAYAVLINVAVAVAAVVLHWPKVAN